MQHHRVLVTLTKVAVWQQRANDGREPHASSDKWLRVLPPASYSYSPRHPRKTCYMHLSRGCARKGKHSPHRRRSCPRTETKSPAASLVIPATSQIGSRSVWRPPSSAPTPLGILYASICRPSCILRPSTSVDKTRTRSLHRRRHGPHELLHFAFA